jgi:hypothetical protein
LQDEKPKEATRARRWKHPRGEVDSTGGLKALKSVSARASVPRRLKRLARASIPNENAKISGSA